MSSTSSALSDTLSNNSSTGSSTASDVTNQEMKEITSKSSLDKGQTNENLLDGENFQGIDHDVTYICPYDGPKRGTLTFTNYKLNFTCLSKGRTFFVQCPLGNITRIEKVGGVTSKGLNAYGIDVVCKDMRNLRFAYKQENHSRRQMFDTLCRFAFPSTHKLQVFAFSYNEPFKEDGWEVYSPISEMKRQGLSNDLWKLSKLNEQFELCDTYPTQIFIPRAASDDLTRACAAFRSRNRLPILSWIHRKSQASITRCSQPSVGVAGKRSKEDERYVSLIMQANNGSSKIIFFDARPGVNAVANKTRGGGYESEDNYENMEFHFLDIHNIHVMRESRFSSLRKVKEICYPTDDSSNWFTKVESTHWLDHIKTIISGALRIAEKIEGQKTSVIVHCSDGWDRTAQLTCMAMIMLDPYYRTIRGFEVLIEQEWISFGHKFQERIGHGYDKPTDSERSPVFLQFLDCVWQITQQFPNAFEFNEAFLLAIADHLYSCLFGTFLCSCDAERQKWGLKTHTVSLWSYINSAPSFYENSLYASYLQHVIYPVASLRRISLWKGYFLLWNPRHNMPDPSQLMERQLLRLKNQLQCKIEALREKQNRQA